LVVITSITNNSAQMVNATPRDRFVSRTLSKESAVSRKPLAWYGKVCTWPNQYSLMELMELMPYARWYRLYPPKVYTHLPTLLPTPLPNIQVIPTASPGSISIPATGKALYIDQTLQVMRVYENGVEVRTIPVSTGMRMSYTPAFSGRISVYVKMINSFGNLADHAWYFTEATGNIYIHGAPYAVTDGQKQYVGLEWLGVKPSSHGCVRIHPLDAEWLVVWDPRNGR